MTRGARSVAGHKRDERIERAGSIARESIDVAADAAADAARWPARAARGALVTVAEGARRVKGRLDDGVGEAARGARERWARMTGRPPRE